MPHDKLQFKRLQFNSALTSPFWKHSKLQKKMQHQLQSYIAKFQNHFIGPKPHSKVNHLNLSYSIRQTMSNTQIATLCKFSNLTSPPLLRCRELKLQFHQDNPVCRTAKAIWAMKTHSM